MTTAQKQIKDKLGDTFDVIVKFSLIRKTYKDSRMLDNEILDYMKDKPGGMSPEQINILHLATDIYDKYF